MWLNFYVEHCRRSISAVGEAKDLGNIGRIFEKRKSRKNVSCSKARIVNERNQVFYQGVVIELRFLDLNINLCRTSEEVVFVFLSTLYLQRFIEFILCRESLK